MHVALRCPCGANLKAPIEAVGRQLKCPKCSQMLVVPEPPMAATSEPVQLEMIEPLEVPPAGQVPQPVPGAPAAQPAAPYAAPAAPYAAARPTHAKKPSGKKVRWPVLVGAAVVLFGIFGGVLYYFYSTTDTGSGDLVLGGGAEVKDLKDLKHVPRGKQPPPEKNRFDSGVNDLANNSDNVPDEDMSMRDLIKVVEPSIVRLRVELFDGSESIGSGFFVDTEGKIFTNYHVVEGATVITVETADGKKTKALGALINAKDRDLAIIQIDPKELRCVPIAIATKLPEKGDDIVAFGAPQGFSFSQTEGTVSSVRHGSEVKSILDEMAPGMNIYSRKGFTTEMDWIQHSASISGGNSGGPLVNMRGEMVGVNTWTHELGQNLNFASTMEQVKEVFSERKEKNGMLLKFQGRSAGSSSAIIGR